MLESLRVEICVSVILEPWIPNNNPFLAFIQRELFTKLLACLSNSIIISLKFTLTLSVFKFGFLLGPRLPAPLYSHCVVQWNKSTTYIIGGMRSDLNLSVNTFYKFDWNSREITLLNATLNVARCSTNIFKKSNSLN